LFNILYDPIFCVYFVLLLLTIAEPLIIKLERNKFARASSLLSLNEFV